VVVVAAVGNHREEAGGVMMDARTPPTHVYACVCMYLYM
jgi:hypothetical protein